MIEHPRFRIGSRDVARMGYGAMQLTGPGVFGPPPDRSEAIRVDRILAHPTVKRIAQSRDDRAELTGLQPAPG